MDEKNERVTDSYENDTRSRCVDIVMREDGRFGFAEWRREPEDPGNWYRMADDGGISYQTQADAVGAARVRVPWFGALAD